MTDRQLLEQPDSEPVATNHKLLELVHADLKLLADICTTIAHPKIPEGWKLVPVEPTVDQLIAGAAAKAQGMDGDVKAAIYTAMVKAAPQPKE